MQKISVLLLIVGISFVFSGCPYESAVPIDQPSMKISRLLLGKWKTAKDPEIYTVTRTDEFNYRIEEKTEKETSYYRGYLSKVNDILFLTLVMEKDAEKKYSFAKIDINANATKVTLSFMSDEIKEKFKSSDDLKSFILKNIAQSNFYEKEMLEFARQTNE